MLSFVQKLPLFKETAGYEVAQLVQVHYKPEGHRFES